MFIDAEDDEPEIHRRLAQILDHYGARFADAWAGGLRLVSLVGRDPGPPIAAAASSLPSVACGAHAIPLPDVTDIRHPVAGGY